MRKRTEEEIKDIVENLGYIYIDSYFKDTRQRKVVIQDKHGYKYDVQLPNALRGGRLSFVDKGNPFSLENISLWLKLNNSQFVLLENNEYKGKDSKLNLYCSKCKDYPKTSWSTILSGKGCGVCKGIQVGERHNLAFQRPDIAKEWHKTLNKDLTSRDITCGSHEKAWWRCPRGHEYLSVIYSRTNSGNGCPICANEQKESKVASELKTYILGKYDSKEEHKPFRNPETNYPLSYDIYIFGGKDRCLNGVYIEVHGGQHYSLNGWHTQLSKKNGRTPVEEFEYQKHLDRLKRRFARKHGTYIEIDLRKTKTVEQAIEYVESILKTL